MRRTKGISPPSNRDAIESWLDVLVSMLNLPPSQRTQVRDELEDHLRSRVDDLLIMGKSEPDAIQAAIQELGETAELAKLISSASRTRTPFRRFAMNATFFVLAGSIMTASISMMMPSSSMPTSSEITHEQPDAGSAKPTQKEAKSTASFDLENAAFMEKFSAIAEAFDDKIQPSKGFTELAMKDPAFYLTSPFKGEFTKIEALSELRRQHPAIDFSTKMTVGSSFVMIQTREEADRASIRVEAYPMPVWAETRSDQLGFSNSVQELIRVKHDLEFTSIQAMNGMLVVAAPPEVHAEIYDMAAQLKVLAEEMRAKNQARREQQRAAKDRQLKALEREYEMAKTVYIETQRQLGKLQSERAQLDSQRSLEILEIGRPTQKDHNKVNEKYAPKMDVLDQRISEFHFEVEEARGRFERLQTILIDAEADFILSNLNEPVGQDAGAGPSGSRIVYIQGPGDVRSGAYKLPEIGKLNLARFLISANAGEDAGTVSLKRDGQTRIIGDADDILSGKIEDTALRPDDQVVISAAD